jgi:hypothetical protein
VKKGGQEGEAQPNHMALYLIPTTGKKELVACIFWSRNAMAW